MDESGVILTVPDMSKWDKKFILGQLHAHADEIADQILKRIEARTPVATGALKEDETYELPSGGSVNSPLVTWFVGDEYQIAENKREYDVYQEGPPLGLETYTNGPHQMFFKVTTDDLPLIEQWAQEIVDDAVEQTMQSSEENAITQEFF